MNDRRDSIAIKDEGVWTTMNVGRFSSEFSKSIRGLICLIDEYMLNVYNENSERSELIKNLKGYNERIALYIIILSRTTNSHEIGVIISKLKAVFDSVQDIIDSTNDPTFSIDDIVNTTIPIDDIRKYITRQDETFSMSTSKSAISFFEDMMKVIELMAMMIRKEMEANIGG